MLSLVPFVLLAAQCAVAFNFPYESTQLEDSDVADNENLAFGTLPVSHDIPNCKVFPGDVAWPSVASWEAFNVSLDGVLIKGIPPAASCYDGPYYDTATCNRTRAGQFSSLWAQEDPIIPFEQWQLGNPCPVPSVSLIPSIALCNITSFPAYSVNATTVKHVQAAVNFARNHDIRLAIKNTGHDFLGRNTGGGALIVWTHHLKAFEYVPSFTVGEYSGPAARVGAALEQYELHSYMTQYNITMLAPASTTVGAFGGFMQGGGFSTIVSSKLGLMSDQVLGLEIVTADGNFVHADHTENEDLFWAIRGGGPGNFGIVTSAIIKAYDVLPISTVDFSFGTFTTPISNFSMVHLTDSQFWTGISIYFSNLRKFQNAGGVGWNNIYSFPSWNSTLRISQFLGEVNLPGLTSSEATALVEPMFASFRAAGINITSATPKYFPTYPQQAYRPQGIGEGVGNGRFASRLIPRENFEDSTKFNDTMAVIRNVVEEGGYSFHSVDYAVPESTAGYPGANSAVNPHLRAAAMHISTFDFASYGPSASPSQQIASHDRLNTYMNKLREVSPTSGAYMNEADVDEPNFKESFYGSNYAKLYEIKKDRDPWGVFYAVTGVSSDEWYAEGTQGLNTQQGRLCRR